MGNFKVKKRLRLKFAVGFGIGIIVPLLLIGLFNLIIDPYQLSKNRIAGINDALSHRNFMGESALKNAFQAYSKGNQATVSLVGTSHIASGISVSNEPAIEKFALAGLRLNEGLQIAQMIIDESKVSKTIFIELGSTRETKRGERLKFQKRYFDAQATLESIRIIARSIRFRNQDDKFQEEVKFKLLLKISELSEQKERLVDYFRINIPDSLTSNLISKNRGINHRIVFFTSPLPIGFVEAFELEELVKLNHQNMRQVVSRANAHNDHIQFDFVGLVGTSIGKEYLPWTEDFHNGWYDEHHYQPVIGEQILAYLLDQSNWTDGGTDD